MTVTHTANKSAVTEEDSNRTVTTETREMVTDVTVIVKWKRVGAVPVVQLSDQALASSSSHQDHM